MGSHWVFGLLCESTGNRLVADVQVYTLCLCLLLLRTRQATFRVSIELHLRVLLLLGWSVDSYQNFWPLGTTYLSATDGKAWQRFALLSIVAVILPLLAPRTHSPVYPEPPSSASEINPEQTASWLSSLTYGYVSVSPLFAGMGETC